MTHDPMCPCSKADERGCFLISANTGKCVSCVCGDKMDTYLDGYDRALRAAREAIKKQALYLDPECEYRALSAIEALRDTPTRINMEDPL
jgi:hypothetical protein